MDPRPRRHRTSYNKPGHAHELTFGCYRAYPFFKRERVYEWFADSLNAVRRELDMALWAYVFMPTHVHLVVHFGRHEYEIAQVLSKIKWPVSRKALAFLPESAPEWLAKLQTQRGQKTEFHFWQRGGGYDRNIAEPATLEKMIGYVHLNPVRRGLVERAIDWNWSSASWFANGSGPVPLDRIPGEWTVGMSHDF